MRAFFLRLESVGTGLAIATAGFCVLAGDLGFDVWSQPPFLYLVLGLLVIGLALGASGWCGRKLGVVLLTVAAVAAAALAIASVLALGGPMLGLVILAGFPAWVFVALRVARRRGRAAPALTLFCSRPAMSALISAYIVLGAASVFANFGGPEIVGHILANPAKPELEFEYRLCPGDTVLPGSAAPPTIQWEATNIARVSAIAEANCGTSWLFGDYAVKGDTITLEYQAIVGVYKLCTCAHRASYRIRDIPRRDYVVQIRDRPEVYSRLWLWKLLGLVEGK